jgi:prolyl oligopeptidase
MEMSHPNSSYVNPRRTPHTLLWLVPLVLLLAVPFSWTWPSKISGPPPTRTDNVKEVIHGVTIADPYRWLEDQQRPETRSWIDAQNKYTRSLLDPWPGREALKRRLTDLMKVDTIQVPVERNGCYFFEKRLADQDQAVLYMRKRVEGNDEVLVDPNPLSPDHTTSVDLLSVSRDGRLLAYGLRSGGEDETTLALLDVESRRDLPDHLPKARYFGVRIKPDDSGFYYTRFGAEGSRVYYHAMGTDPAKDSEVFGKGYAPDKIIFASLSEDGHYLTIHVLHGSAADRTEVYCQDLAEHGPLVPIVNDVAARFFGQVAGDQLFLRTNWKAPKGRVLVVDLKNPGRDHWREIVPEGQPVIESVSLAGGRLFVDYTENASSRVSVFSEDGKHVSDLALPSIGSVSAMSGRWTSEEMFYGFTSFHIRLTIYRYDVATGKQTVWAQEKVPLRTENLAVKQVWYRSKDKTRVPMFLLYRKGLKLNGSNPALLTGYGGFNVSVTPHFSAMAALWAEQGGVFALPNLRGGGEFGEAWHKGGMLGKKQNVFDDFLAAAEWLIDNGYTKPSRLAIRGTSNGGLLVGAALTQRPDLFQAVVCGYPLLDMLRYQKFLVARFWVSEYGSADDPAQFKYLYAYSPYQHVEAGTKYPAVLFVSGDSDTRVAPLHARKMCALLQAATGSERPVLLRYDTAAGHSRGLPVGKQIDDLTDEMEFLFWQLGAPFEGKQP